MNYRELLVAIRVRLPKSVELIRLDVKEKYLPYTDKFYVQLNCVIQKNGRDYSFNVSTEETKGMNYSKHLFKEGIDALHTVLVHAGANHPKTPIV